MRFYIQALKNTDLFYITFDELEFLYRNYIEFNAVGRILTIKYLKIWHQQARNIRMMTAEERYAYFLNTQPELAYRVPVQDLASHLDMSRETLSRLRGKI